MNESDRKGAARVKRGKKRTREGSITPSKGEGSEGLRRKKRREGRGGWGKAGRGRMMNSVTVTTSSIKQPHYTIISTHLHANTHTQT